LSIERSLFVSVRGGAMPAERELVAESRRDAGTL